LSKFHCERVEATDYGLRTTDYGLRTTDYGLRTTDYGLRTPNRNPLPAAELISEPMLYSAAPANMKRK
jgi:hypothetical protein